MALIIAALLLVTVWLGSWGLTFAVLIWGAVCVVRITYNIFARLYGKATNTKPKLWVKPPIGQSVPAGVCEKYQKLRKDAWEKRVYDPDLEAQLTRYIRDSRDIDAVLADVSVAFPPDNQPHPNRDVPLYAGEQRLFLHILMAKYGKQPKHTPGYSFSLQYADNERQMPAQREKLQRDWERTVSAAVYIQQKMRDNGVEHARLIFMLSTIGMPMSYSYQPIDVPKVCSIDDIRQVRYMPGYIEWLPNTGYDDNLERMIPTPPTKKYKCVVYK